MTNQLINAQQAIMDSANVKTYWTIKEDNEWREDMEFSTQSELVEYLIQQMIADNQGLMYRADFNYGDYYTIGQFYYDENDEKRYIKEVEKYINIEDEYEPDDRDYLMQERV